MPLLEMSRWVSLEIYLAFQSCFRAVDLLVPGSKVFRGCGVDGSWYSDEQLVALGPTHPLVMQGEWLANFAACRVLADLMQCPSMHGKQRGSQT